MAATLVATSLGSRPALAACANPVRNAGDIIYNADHAQMQYCDGTDWISMGKVPPDVDPCNPANSPAAGQACDDGTVYAGLSPDGNVAMYTMAADEGGFAWNNGNSSGYTTTSQTSATTGATNTANLITIDSNSGAGGTQPHQAAQICADSSANGHSDWHLPAYNELNVLCTNKAAIGGFNTSGSNPAGYYWSSSEVNTNYANFYRFSDCTTALTFTKFVGFSVRCVRKGYVAGGSGACTTPPGALGTMFYNSDYRVPQYCNGSQWVAMGPTGETCDFGPWTSQSAAEANFWYSIAYGNGLFVAVAFFGTNLVMTSPDGITWTPRPAVGSSFTSITYGDGQFVAVSQSGTNRVMTSPDGITWTPRAAAEANLWREITYGNGLFVALSQDGTNRVMTSPDGITWTPRAAAEANAWTSVTYGDGKFVAVANNGANRVMTSPDGITWTPRAAAGNGQWISVTYGNRLFVAVAGGGTDRAMTSSDGITWTAEVPSANNTWSDVAYGDGLFAAVASDGAFRVMTAGCPHGCSAPDHVEGTIMYNADCAAVQYCNGVRWHPVGKKIDDAPDQFTFSDQTDVALSTLTSSNSVNISGVSCSVPVSVSGQGNPEIRIDGGSWTTGPAYITNGQTLEVRLTSNAANSVTNSATVTVGNTSEQWDVKTLCYGFSEWTPRATEFGNQSWEDVASSDDGTKLAAVVNGGYIYTSTDSGVTWTERTGAGARGWTRIASSGDGTVLAAAAGTSAGTNLYISTNSGANWTARGNAAQWQAIALSNDGVKMVASEGSVITGNIWTSTNTGANWTQRVTGGSHYSLASSADGVNLLVAGYSGGNIRRSTDSGVNWANSLSFGSNNWVNVFSSDDGTTLASPLFSGNVFTSTNSGSNWTNQSGSGSRGWSDIDGSSDGTKLAASGLNTQIYTSDDSGVTWTPWGVNRMWQGIASSADGSKLVATTGPGNIYTSQWCN